MSSMSSVILADQVSPLPCFYNNSTQTGKLTITVHSWSVSQTIIIAGCVREGREGREGKGGKGREGQNISIGNYFPGE